jgi:hypothetical protein
LIYKDKMNMARKLIPGSERKEETINEKLGKEI